MEKYEKKIEEQRRLFLKEKQIQEKKLANGVTNYIKRKKRSPWLKMLGKAANQLKQHLSM